MKKQTIWVWGDSWSVPNYGVPRTGYRAKYHPSEILGDLGHTVNNFGQNGAGNMVSIREAENSIPYVEDKVDWILWFHTAILRDCGWLGLTGDDYSGTLIPKAAESVYTSAKNVIDKTGARLILVEGHAPLYEPLFSTMVEPFYKVLNWRGKILGIPDFPQSHWYCQGYQLGVDTGLTMEQKETEVENLEVIQNAICESPLFVDDNHPGDVAYIQLTADILQVIYNNS
jgi:hypothetical protein